ncbi:MAG: hypothetical protein M1829_004631 [Trizodia sp. TS-e1964]|nr:MAG: hypothetical protein M1829_004631 [Trizodia sp. TS-e1964]
MRSSLSQRGDEHQPWLYLISINGTFERKSISVPYYPDILRIGRQTNAKTVPTSSNGFFDSKVLSRQHAEIWADPNGKIWIRDVKSSNGTFVNGERLSPENRESEPHELLAHDVLELGIDIVSEDQKSVVHQKVSARVEHVGHLSGLVESSNQLNFGDSDLNNQGGMIPPSLGHNIPHYRGRALDQQLNMGNRRSANAASNNLGAMAQHQRHLNFWLTPITMEHIVKKMTSELKSAKQQNMDLQRTTDFFSSLVTKNNISLPQNSDLSQCWKDELPEISPGDPNSPFHSPPAPPPKLPLPVKSEVSKPYPPQTPPRLNRSDTERPKLSGNLSSGDSDASYQILSLAEELAASKKEVESKSARVRDLEDLLVRERKARESAEDRARRLEVESGCLHEIVKDDKRSFQSNFSSGTLHDDIGIGVKENKDGKRQLPVEEDIDDMWDDSLNIDASTLRLQKRLDKMVNDMNEMKQLMEQYRCRAVDAEKERDSTRSSLAELVQKIRKDEMERDIKGQESKALTEFGINTLIQPLQLPKDSYKRMGNQAVIINGNPGGPVNISELRKLATSTAALATSRSSLGPRYQISPYASIFTVVILGVGLMAFLNNDWPKAEN